MVVPGVAVPPPDLQTHVQIKDAMLPEDAGENDTGWIAHFYLMPNHFMFPNTAKLALIGLPPLRLEEARDVPGTRYPTRVYPHPSGSLGLVVVSSREPPPRGTDKEKNNPQAAALERAYDVAAAVLDDLAVRYDSPLPIAHSLLLGVPSGVFNVFFAHRSGFATIERNVELLAGPRHPELKDAYALYREAASSNNPFHTARSNSTFEISKGIWSRSTDWM